MAAKKKQTKKAAAKGRAKKAAPKRTAKKSTAKKSAAKKSAKKRASAKKAPPAKRKAKKSARTASRKRPGAGRPERLAGGDVSFTGLSYTDSTGTITKVKVVVQPGPKQSAVTNVTNGAATVTVPGAINVTRITVQTDPGLGRTSSKSFNSSSAPTNQYYASGTADTTNATSDTGTTVTGSATSPPPG